MGCADELARVARAYQARLSELEAMLHNRTLNCECDRDRWYEEVSTARLQLAVVTRRLRGLNRMLRRLGEDTDLQSLKGYWEDVADHVQEAYDDTWTFQDKCKNMLETYEHMQDREQETCARRRVEQLTMREERMNRILFVLTIVTTVFTPVTFLAGVYGMNFVDDEGDP